MTSRERVPTAPLYEGLISPEKPRLILAKHLLIVGDSNTGKSTVARLLAGILDTEVITGSGLINRRDTGSEIGLQSNTGQQHFDLDESTRKSFELPGPKNVYELKLAAICAAEKRAQIMRENLRIAKQRQRGNFSEDYLSDISTYAVLFTAEDPTREDRAIKDANRNAASNGLPQPDPDEVVQEMYARTDKDTVDWALVHPDYVTPHVPPYDPRMIGPDGRLIHDLVINTTNISAMDATRQILEILPIARAALPRIDPPNIELGLI